MKRILLPLIAFVLIGFMSNGQTKESKGFIEIGDGTLATTDPIYVNWNYAWGSFLYTSEQLGDAKTIDKIAFFAYKDFGGYTAAFEGQKVYFKMTANTNISMAYPDPDANDYTKVYEGTVTYPANGADWMVIDIDDFVYDGTSNLLMHWQNHSGVSLATSGLWYGTVASGMQAVSGSDEAFPSAAAGWEPWNACNPNMRVYFNSPGPETPEIIEPANNAIKIDLGTSISFNLSEATKYDLYFGTDTTDLEKVQTDIAVSADGEYSYTPSEILKGKTKYFVKIVAKDATDETSSPVYKFETQGVIEYFVWECDFEDYYVSAYTGETLSYVINTNWPDSTDWKFDEYWKCEYGPNTYLGLMSARVSGWHVGDYSLTTPRVKLPKNTSLSFVWRNNYIFEDDKKASKGFNTTYLEVTSDGGGKWIEIDHFTPTEAMTEYVYVMYDVSDFSGDNTYFRWRYHEEKEYNPECFWVDNIKIAEKKDGAEMQLNVTDFQYAERCIGSYAAFEVVVRNIGTKDLVINKGVSDGPFESDYTGTIVPDATDTAVVYFRPEKAGDFNELFTFISNDTISGAQITVKGSAYEPFAEFFEGFDVVRELPEKWNAIDSPWDNYSEVTFVQGGYEVFSSPYAAKLIKLNDSISPIILVTPGVTNFDIGELEFVAKKAYADYDLSLEIGTISNPEDASTFVTQKTFELTEEFVKYKMAFKATNKVPYIAFRHSGAAPYTSMRIDDVIWYSGVTEVKPAVNAGPDDNATSVDIMMNPILRWVNGGGGTEGYKVNVGTDNPPTNIINGQNITLAEAKVEITQNLNYGTKYFWQVVPYSSTDDCKNPPVWSFTTMADPTVTSFPYTENFDEVVNVQFSNDYPLGWSYEDIHGDNITWDVLMANNSFPDIVKGKAGMHVPFHPTNYKDDYLFTPPMALRTGKTYDLSFMIHTVQDMVLGVIFNEEIEVRIGKGNSSGMMTSDVLVYANVDTEDWKTVKQKFTVEANDTYYLAFHAISEPAYLLMLDNIIINELVPGSNAPEFTSTPVDSVAANQLYTYMVTTSDADNDLVQVSAPTAPSWLNLTKTGDGIATLSGNPTTVGSFDVVLSATDGKNVTEQSFTLKVKEGVGINDENQLAGSVYPNPTQGIFTLSSEGLIINGIATVVDVDGSVVYSMEINNVNQNINIEHLNSGFYYLVLPTEQGLIKHKIVKE